MRVLAGLTRENSHVGDIVVGAASRLSGYERVQVTNQLRDPVGVVARAVEPVAVTVTELMANALHYSHPGLPVVVTVQQGNRGVSEVRRGVSPAKRGEGSQGEGTFLVPGVSQSRRDGNGVASMGEPGDRATPIGTKGVGEIGLAGIAAAVANAVHHARAGASRSLPVTLEDLLQEWP